MVSMKKGVLSDMNLIKQKKRIIPPYIFLSLFYPLVKNVLFYSSRYIYFLIRLSLFYDNIQFCSRIYIAIIKTMDIRCFYVLDDLEAFEPKWVNHNGI